MLSRIFFVLFSLTFFNGELFPQDGLNTNIQAPDFKLKTVNDDLTISLSTFVNKKIVVIHFWKSN